MTNDRARAWTTRGASAALAAILLLTLIPALAAYGAEPFSVAIVPETLGNTAIKAGQRVEVNGAAPAGSTIAAARFLALDESGDLLGSEPVPELDLNRFGIELSELTSDFIRVNELGQLEGQLTVRCTFGDPSMGGTCAPQGVRQAVLEVTFAGHDDPFRSGPVPVDYTRPRIASYDLIGTSSVRVNFTEPVRMPAGQPELASDWVVTSPAATVAAVSGSGDSRILMLVEPLGEDATPQIAYSVTPIPQRTGYEDFASNRHHSSGFNASAADLIRPAAPTIEAVNGTAPSSGAVFGNVGAPTLRVGNMLRGHDVLVTISGDGFTDTIEHAAEGTSTDITLPSLAAEAVDATFSITTVARDIHGNRSDNADLASARQDGGPTTVEYHLDTVRPTIIHAKQVTTSSVRVRLSEPVVPDGDAGTWTVGGEPATADGDGGARTLTLSGAVPPDATVAWAPADTTYRDGAGNDLTGRENVAVELLPPLAPPTVSTPAGVHHVNGDAFPVTVAGSASPGTSVEIVEPAADRVVATVAADDSGSWSAALDRDAFPDDGRYRLVAAATDPQTQQRSDPAAVPDIIVDTTAPSVTVHEPSHQLPTTTDTDTRPAFLLGEPVTVAYTASDAASSDAEDSDHGKRVVVAIVTDEGRRVLDRHAPYAPGERREFAYRVHERDLGNRDVREAQFEVTTIDEAGNRMSQLSAAVRLVRPQSPISFVPLRLRDNVDDRAYVDIRFPISLKGTTTAVDWRVGGEIPLKAAQVDDRVVRLTLVPSDSDFDPNLRPMVSYDPAIRATRLHATTDGGGVREVIRTDRRTRDGIDPELFASPSARGPMRARAFTISGSTDTSSVPPTIRVWRVNSRGQYLSGMRTYRAGADGTFTIRRGLHTNTLHRFHVQAVDSQGNRSRIRAFSVINDIKKPKVALRDPDNRQRISRGKVRINWVARDRHFDRVRLHYRVNRGPLYKIAEIASSKATIFWNPPNKRVRPGRSVALRVVAIDRAGNRRTDWVRGLWVRP